MEWKDRDEDMMRRALALAILKMREGHGGPFGAVVVQAGRIVGEGWNQVTSENDPTAHAEIVAIRDACRRLGRFELSGCEIYSSCEPCPMCLAAIHWARLSRITYGNDRHDAAAIGFDDAVLYDEVAKPVGQRLIPCRRMLSDEAKAAFAEWVANPGKVPY